MLFCVHLTVGRGPSGRSRTRAVRANAPSGSGFGANASRASWGVHQQCGGQVSRPYGAGLICPTFLRRKGGASPWHLAQSSQAGRWLRANIHPNSLSPTLLASLAELCLGRVFNWNFVNGNFSDFVIWFPFINRHSSIKKKSFPLSTKTELYLHPPKQSRCSIPSL